MPTGLRLPRFAIAVAAVALALAIRHAVGTGFGPSVPYVQFYPAIFLAAWFGGLGPALVATGLATAAASYFALPPDGFAVESSADQLSLGVFASTGVLIAWLVDRLQVAEEGQRLRVRLEGELGASEARWRAVVDSAVDAILVIDSHGCIETFNPAAERLFGYTSPEVLGRNVAMLMPSPHREQHDSYLSRYMATGQATIIGIGREVQGRRKDGTTFPLHLSVAEITIGGERRFTGILHDLTARVRLETRLREQAALAHLGEMAAVVAHEVKNPLAGIRGAMQVLSGRASDATSREVLQEVVERIDALDGMIKDLLLFARPPRPRRVSTDVVLLATSTAALMAQDPALQGVEVAVEGSAPAVAVDAEMLRIVLHNLMVNGAQAMQGRGRINVAVGIVDAACRIAVADHGPGIPAEIRDKVFTPFFTTKSRGSGLGLPTAKRLIEAHDGSIVIDCPITGGTTVVVQLPMPPVN